MYLDTSSIDKEKGEKRKRLRLKNAFFQRDFRLCLLIFYTSTGI